MDESKIQDLDEWAEDHFSGLCSRAGVTRNKSRQDRTGWDYIVEFRTPLIADVPADLQPTDTSARVQVKSKEHGPPFLTMKLSNALRFAKEPMPCFIVLVLATHGAEPVRLYARHFWKEEMEAALKRARKADAEGRDDLHKLKVRFSFSDADEHSTDLLAWMKSVIEGRSGYADEKRALSQTIGFEDGWVHGTLSIAPEDIEALIDHQIGLLPIAPVASITIKQRRFGIDARTPLFSGKPDFVNLRSHPEPCRVRVRSQEERDIWLDGELLLPALPGLSDEQKRLRVVADSVEILIRAKGESQITLVIAPDRRRSLTSHRNQIDVLRWAAAGSLNVLIESEGRPGLAFDVALECDQDEFAASQFLNVIACLEKAGAGILPPDLALSRDEIDSAWNAIVDFNGFVTGTDFEANLEFEEPPKEFDSPPTAALGFDYVEIGDWAFGAVVRRKIERFEINGTRGSLALGPGRVVEAIVRRGNGESIMPELCALYRRAHEPEKKTALEMFGGNFRALREFAARA